ncbi:hypothetical protein ACHAXS_010619, partial [Conticribra weissflogii]
VDVVPEFVVYLGEEEGDCVWHEGEGGEFDDEWFGDAGPGGYVLIGDIPVKKYYINHHKSRLPLDHESLQLLSPLNHGLVLLHLLLRMLHGQIVHFHLVFEALSHAFHGVDLTAQRLQLGGEFLKLGLESVFLGGERVHLALEGGEFVIGGLGTAVAVAMAAVT